MKSRLAFAFALCALAACSGTSSSDPIIRSGTGGSGGSSGGGGGGGEGGGPLFDAGSGGGNGGSGGGGVDDCAASAKLVYVVTEQNGLFSLDPSQLPASSAFNAVGTLNCPAAFGATPFSMAVQRNGTAWVVFNDGTLWNVSTKDASCTPTNFQVGQSGFTTFGMGFVSDSAGSTSETLYVAKGDAVGGGSGGLAKIDLKSLVLTPVGPLDPGAELTGTGDGRLYAFFEQTNSATIDEVNKQSGGVLSSAPQSGVTVGNGWAFAFWGGSFWMFTAPTGASEVTQYDPMKGSTQVIVQNLPQLIVGAGVSTCAPIAPPH